MEGKEQLAPNGTYTAPQISIANSKDWFIYFRFYHDGKEYLRKKREGLNRIKDKGQRIVEAERLHQQYTDRLKKGWNPIIDPEFKVRNIKPLQAKQDMCLKEAIVFALSKKNLAHESKFSYSCMLNLIEKNSFKARV